MATTLTPLALKNSLAPEDRIATLLQHTTELLELHRVSLASHASLQESQRRLETAATAAEEGQLTIQQRLQTLLATTGKILGVTTRTERLVGALRRGNVRAAAAALLLDEWTLLFCTILLRPFFPAPVESFVAVWQFVLFAQRVWWLPADLREGRLVVPSLGGLLANYFTSPWKALFLLYWLNHRAFQMDGTDEYARFFPGTTWAAPQFTLPDVAPCWDVASFPRQSHCLATATLTATAYNLQSLADSLAVPGVLFQFGLIVEVEQLAAGWALGQLAAGIALLFRRALADLRASACRVELSLGSWVGTIQPFSVLCPA